MKARILWILGRQADCAIQIRNLDRTPTSGTGADFYAGKFYLPEEKSLPCKKPLCPWGAAVF